MRSVVQTSSDEIEITELKRLGELNVLKRFSEIHGVVFYDPVTLLQTQQPFQEAFIRCLKSRECLITLYLLNNALPFFK